MNAAINATSTPSTPTIRDFVRVLIGRSNASVTESEAAMGLFPKHAAARDHGALPPR